MASRLEYSCREPVFALVGGGSGAGLLPRICLELLSARPLHRLSSRPQLKKMMSYIAFRKHCPQVSWRSPDRGRENFVVTSRRLPGVRSGLSMGLRTARRSDHPPCPCWHRRQRLLGRGCARKAHGKLSGRRGRSLHRKQVPSLQGRDLLPIQRAGRPRARLRALGDFWPLESSVLRRMISTTLEPLVWAD